MRAWRVLGAHAAWHDWPPRPRIVLHNPMSYVIPAPNPVKEMGFTWREPPFFFMKPADAVVKVLVR